MDLAYYLGKAWEFVDWFANMVFSTVANSIFGGWTAVIALGVAALILFLLTRLMFHRSDES